MLTRVAQQNRKMQIMNRLRMGTCLLVGLFLFIRVVMAQNKAMENSMGIVVQARDGRNGKPLAHQRLLVFTGESSSSVKSHASHIGLTTDKDGLGTLTINPSEIQWIQVWADGRVLCQPNPNERSFSVATIMSKGLTAPNNCSALLREAAPGHFVLFARPARFMEKMKR
jgi:hypothetical protein